MTQPREALLARFRAGLVERVRTTQRLVDAFQSSSDPDSLRQALQDELSFYLQVFGIPPHAANDLPLQT